MTYPPSCGELPRETQSNIWAAALPLLIPETLGERNTSNLGLPCLPSANCSDLRKVLMLFQHPFPQPHAGRQANPAHLLHASAKPHQPFVVLPTVLPVASCFHFGDLPHIHPSAQF